MKEIYCLVVKSSEDCKGWNRYNVCKHVYAGQVFKGQENGRKDSEGYECYEWPYRNFTYNGTIDTNRIIPMKLCIEITKEQYDEIIKKTTEVKHELTIDGKTINISDESYKELKKLFKDQ